MVIYITRKFTIILILCFSRTALYTFSKGDNIFHIQPSSIFLKWIYNFSINKYVIIFIVNCFYIGLIGKDPNSGKDGGQEEKGTTEDETVGWRHWLDRHEFKQALRVGDGQGNLACCSPWGHKELDTTDPNPHRLYPQMPVTLFKTTVLSPKMFVLLFLFFNLNHFKVIMPNISRT